MAGGAAPPKRMRRHERATRGLAMCALGVGQRRVRGGELRLGTGERLGLQRDHRRHGSTKQV